MHKWENRILLINTKGFVDDISFEKQISDLKATIDAIPMRIQEMRNMKKG